MKRFPYLSLVVSCLLLFTWPSRAESSPDPKPARDHKTLRVPELRFEKYALPNGLEVILSEDHSLPLVSVNLWYHVGPANERPGRTGFAHLFEHMMFEGSEHIGPKAHFRFLEAAGASDINGTTNFDRTNYFETLPANQLELALWLESDRMGFLLPTLDQAKLRNQRDVVRNERRQTTENVPYGLVEEEVYHELFPKAHPYYADVIGSHRDIEAAELPDVREFFREYYSPNNASLTIVGDFDRKETKALVLKYFASLPRGPEVPRTSVTTPEIFAERRAVVTDQVELPRVYLAWLTPPAYQTGNAESVLLAEILGAGKSSRLYQKLVREKQLAQSVSAENDSEKLASVFEVQATAKPGVNPEELEKAMEAEIERLGEEGPTKEEVERARNATESANIRRLESFGAVANRLNQYNQYLRDPGYLRQDIERFEKVSPSGIQSAAREELAVRSAVVVYGIPGKKVVDDVPRSPAPEESKASEALAARTERNAEQWRSAVPRPREALEFHPPVPVTFELRNGLKVFLVERHKLPIVSANLVVLAGADRNPPGKAGLASFLTAMLDEGTTKHSAEELAAAMDQLGALVTTSSGYDSSSLSLRVLSKNAAPGLALLAEMALDPALRAEEIARVRSRRLTALREEKATPSVLRTATVNRMLYGDSAYGYSTLGTEPSLRAITREDLAGFWMHDWVPSNAALVVAGDIRESELRKLAETGFGRWAGPAALPRIEAAPAAPTRAIYVVDNPGASQTSLAVATVGAARNTPDYIALEVLNMVFGGQFTSRINMNLREEHGYTYGAYSGFAFRQSPGPFSATAGIRTDVTAPAVRELFHELERIRTSEVSPEELELAKGAWALSLAGDFETTADVAGTEGRLFVYGLPNGYYGTLAEEIDRVRAADVLRVATKYLRPEAMVVVAVGDRARILPELEKLGLGEVVTVP
jgi:zinc protease